jgi:hypothetical protein
MGLLQIKLTRGSEALRLTDPETSVLIGGLADIAADLETRRVSWIDGMAFVDRLRETATTRNAPSSRPHLELVSDRDAPRYERIAADKPAPERIEPGELPDDATDPATPVNLLPRRTL